MSQTRFVVRGGMLTALTLALLYLASLAPTGQIGLCAVAGVIPAAPLSRRRVALGASVHAASAILAFLILPKKSIAFLYAVIFGAYSLVKYAIEKLKSCTLQWLCKILYAGGGLAAAVLVAPILGMPDIRLLSVFTNTDVAIAVVLALYFTVFVMYDIAFSRLITLLRRIFPAE